MQFSLKLLWICFVPKLRGLLRSLTVSYFAGVFLVLTPTYIIGTELLSQATGEGRAVFCYAVESQYLVFTFGIVSLYTATLMAIERWFAVFRPLSCKAIFCNKKIRIYLLIVWLGSFAANSTHIIETKYVAEQPGTTTKGRCTFCPQAGNTARKIIGMVEISIKLFIPVLIMLVTFVRLFAFMRKSATCVIRIRSQLVLRRVTHMAAATAVVMTLCWTPNQIYYLLFKFSLVELNSRWHLATVILCMSNSCLNPCIFLLSNKVYRRKVQDMVPRCGPCKSKDLVGKWEPSKQKVVCVKLTKCSHESGGRNCGNVQKSRD